MATRLAKGLAMESRLAKDWQKKTRWAKDWATAMQHRSPRAWV
jgi:hypothetical protein